MRGNDINADRELYGGVVCPMCFIFLAKQQGVVAGWYLEPAQEVDGLILTTPSGRVWDAVKRLWVEGPQS